MFSRVIYPAITTVREHAKVNPARPWAIWEIPVDAVGMFDVPGDIWSDCAVMWVIHDVRRLAGCGGR